MEQVEHREWECSFPRCYLQPRVQCALAERCSPPVHTGAGSSLALMAPVSVNLWKGREWGKRGGTEKAGAETAPKIPLCPLDHHSSWEALSKTGDLQQHLERNSPSSDLLVRMAEKDSPISQKSSQCIAEVVLKWVGLESRSRLTRDVTKAWYRLLLLPRSIPRRMLRSLPATVPHPGGIGQGQGWERSNWGMPRSQQDPACARHEAVRVWRCWIWGSTWEGNGE